MKISGERRLSHDLNQEQMELPATYIYWSTDVELYSKLLLLVGEATKGYNKVNNKTQNRRRKTLQENRTFLKKKK